MAYATEQDLRDRLGSDVLALLADEDGDGSGDPSILVTALDDGASQIDSRLAARYAVPASPAPASLTRLNVDLAIYFLFLRRREAISAEHLARSKEAIAFLEDVASGKFELEDLAPKVGRLEAEGTVREQDRLFDRESLEPF